MTAWSRGACYRSNQKRDMQGGRGHVWHAPQRRTLKPIDYVFLSDGKRPQKNKLKNLGLVFCVFARIKTANRERGMFSYVNMHVLSWD